MTAVVVSQPLRTSRGSVTPADFDDIALCDSVEWGEGGALTLTFPDTLTPSQVVAVRVRCITTDADQESLLLAGWQALQLNLNYLNATPTTAQAVAQVAALTRQVNGLIRFATREI